MTDPISHSELKSLSLGATDRALRLFDLLDKEKGYDAALGGDAEILQWTADIRAACDALDKEVLKEGPRL